MASQQDFEQGTDAKPSSRNASVTNQESPSCPWPLDGDTCTCTFPSEQELAAGSASLLMEKVETQARRGSREWTCSRSGMNSHAR